MKKFLFDLEIKIKNKPLNYFLIIFILSVIGIIF
jgi:hypothetical protein